MRAVSFYLVDGKVVAASPNDLVEDIELHLGTFFLLPGTLVDALMFYKSLQSHHLDLSRAAEARRQLGLRIDEISQRRLLPIRALRRFVSDNLYSLSKWLEPKGTR